MVIPYISHITNYDYKTITAILKKIDYRNVELN